MQPHGLRRHHDGPGRDVGRTTAPAPTTAPSPMCTGPTTTAPAPSRTRSPITGWPRPVWPTVTPWLTQQSSPTDAAVSTVPKPCSTNSPGPTCGAPMCSVASGG